MDPSQLSDYERRIIKRLEKEERKEKKEGKEMKVKPQIKRGGYLKPLSMSQQKQSYHQFKILNEQLSINNNILLAFLLFTLIPLAFTLIFLVLPSVRSISIKFSFGFLMMIYLFTFLLGVVLIRKSILVKAKVRKMKRELAEAMASIKE